jgi:branched-subunit amino acid transport protein
MDQVTILITIFGMALVTYIPRVFPFLLLSGRKLPDLVISWLRYVPPAVLAALLLPSLLFSDGQLFLSVDNLFLWAAIPTFAAAILTRTLFVPVLIGMLVVIVGRLLI